MSEINAVHIKDADSCVTVTAPISKGETVSYHCSNGSIKSVTAKEDIPIYHKLAVATVTKGGFIHKYGEKIGIALTDIWPGDYVHIHNIKPVGFIEEA